MNKMELWLFPPFNILNKSRCDSFEKHTKCSLALTMEAVRDQMAAPPVGSSIVLVI